MSAVNGEIVIHLNALAANWITLKARFSGDDVGAVVKADAYGLGQSRVVSRLVQAGCKTFFVSNLSEAKAVRAVAADANIVVFSGCAEGEEPDFEYFNIQPVIVSVEMLARWSVYKFTHRPSAYLKIDTGMGRYGLSLSDFKKVLEKYRLAQKRVCSLMSHFALSEVPDAPLNQQQIACFERAFSLFQSYVPNARASFCNSSAIFHFAHAHYHTARAGYALYGGNPMPGQANSMQNVVEVKLPVVQLRYLSAGDTVGYGGTFVARSPMVVATVYGGYADGVLRSGAGNLSLYWRDDALPVLGRVSMDSLVIDLTALEPKNRPTEGDMITLIGAHNTLELLASACGTIGYELLTSLSKRFYRVYRD